MGLRLVVRWEDIIEAGLLEVFYLLSIFFSSSFNVVCFALVGACTCSRTHARLHPEHDSYPTMNTGY